MTSDNHALPPELLKKLHRAITAQAAFSKYPVALLQCHENLSQIYLIGGWFSISQHMDDWIPGETNQELIKSLGEHLDVKWMFHVDCEPRAVLDKLVKNSKSGVAVGISRYFVKEGKKGEFAESWRNNVTTLDDWLVGGSDGKVGGHRADWGYVDPHENGASEDGKGKGKDNQGSEFLMFSAWESFEKHMDFTKTELSQQYSKVEEFLDWAEIRHGKLIDFAEV